MSTPSFDVSFDPDLRRSLMFVPSPGGQISEWEEKPLIRIVIFKPSLLMLIYRLGFKGEIEVLLPLKDTVVSLG